MYAVIKGHKFVGTIGDSGLQDKIKSLSNSSLGINQLGNGVLSLTDITVYPDIIEGVSTISVMYKSDPQYSYEEGDDYVEVSYTLSPNKEAIIKHLYSMVRPRTPIEDAIVQAARYYICGLASNAERQLLLSNIGDLTIVDYANWVGMAYERYVNWVAAVDAGITGIEESDDLVEIIGITTALIVTYGKKLSVELHPGTILNNDGELIDMPPSKPAELSKLVTVEDLLDSDLLIDDMSLLAAAKITREQWEQGE